ESNNKLTDAKTIFDKIPGSAFTNGGFLKFGPDGKLYIGTGTVSDSSHLPQDVNSLAGKILRLNDDGTIPNDNPFLDSPVYTLGHRNPQGMTWDESGNMYLAEFGPEKNDEINLIIPGKNYGWPEQQCKGNQKFENAIMCYDPSIEPSGILYYTGERVSLESPFLMASLRATSLFQIDFDKGLNSQKTVLSGIGRIRDVAQGQDGSIYVITSNTDGKGFPDNMDDKLLRILK
ncbi:MAG: PQQ-dependent sugar dehydrogenase, partial [Nitrosarchaeum sp.]|nr:PQQ-dependent sugar dehydrogenase [Nitrosarchaeum sp.]